jgi:hypothetical protein
MLVATLANTEQRGAAPGAVLAWDQTDRRGEVAPATVLLAITEFRDQNTRGNMPNTRNLQQALT